jgi:hypothetical protein
MTLFSTFLLGLALNSHPLHVSYTSIEIKPETRETLVSMKFYTDDFSLLFYHLYEKTVSPEKDKPFAPGELALINNYISQVFVLASGTDTLKLDFARKEQEDEFVWLYYTGVFPESNPQEMIVLSNRLLLDLYNDQTNLVIVTLGNVEKGFSFTYNNWRKELLTLQ